MLNHGRKQQSRCLSKPLKVCALPRLSAGHVFGQQVVPDSPGAVRLIAAEGARPHFGSERLIGSTALAQRSLQPRIGSVARDTERPAHPIPRPDSPVLPDEGELHVDSSANWAAAFLRRPTSAWQERGCKTKPSGLAHCFRLVESTDTILLLIVVGTRIPVGHAVPQGVIEQGRSFSCGRRHALRFTRTSGQPTVKCADRRIARPVAAARLDDLRVREESTLSRRFCSLIEHLGLVCVVKRLGQREDVFLPIVAHKSGGRIVSSRNSSVHYGWVASASRSRTPAKLARIMRIPGQAGDVGGIVMELQVHLSFRAFFIRLAS